MSDSLPRTPSVELLLAAAHRDLAALQQRREALQHAGIGSDLLPDKVALMAFALLGDHERDGLLAGLRGHWGALQAKGLVYGAVEGATTAELRLMEHVREHADAIGPVWDQLREPQNAPEPPHSIWHSTRRVRGLWGQPARVHFAMDNIRHLLIEPDPVFGQQPTLLAANPERRYTGSFELPIDNGNIRISLLHGSGEIYRYVVEVMTEENA